MNLVFTYPADLSALEIMLATKAYEDIWNIDGARIAELFRHYTGLEFLQDKIEVMVHDGQSMSGMDGVPMRLNVQNDTVIKKRNALVHELAHRLLFGNGLYTPQETATDNDEIRVLLFQGDVLRDLYGQADYDYWANLDSDAYTPEHLKDLRYVLSLSQSDKERIIQAITANRAKV